MKKTSVYLDDDDRERLARLARLEGTSQAEIIRKAVAGYVPELRDEAFALARVAEGPGGSIADVPEEDLLAGFGS